ncbi:MAG: DUF3015 family protein [Bdellovibrionota bacterium]
MKKLNGLVGFLALGALSFSFVANTAMAATKQKASYEQPWGMAGCGFASLFIDDKGQLPQMGASVLNIFLSEYTNSFAISSGTSNCVENRAGVAQNEQKAFITVNLASLSKEAAQGDGEHISALAEVFGCPQDEFAKLSQTHYSNIYGTNEPTAVFQNYLKEVNANENLAKSCLRAI